MSPFCAPQIEAECAKLRLTGNSVKTAVATILRKNDYYDMRFPEARS